MLHVEYYVSYHRVQSSQPGNQVHVGKSPKGSTLKLSLVRVAVGQVKRGRVAGREQSLSQEAGLCKQAGNGL